MSDCDRKIRCEHANRSHWLGLGDILSLDESVNEKKELERDFYASYYGIRTLS